MTAASVPITGLPFMSSRNVLSVVALAGVALVRIVLEPQVYVANDASFRAGLAALAPRAQSVFIASTRLSHGFPLVEDAKLRWASRLPTQWLAPYVASKWQGGALPDDSIVQLALTTTVSDLIEDRPDIIFIDQDTDQIYVPGGRFDYLAFWSNDPRFPSFWQGYDQRGMQDGFAVFTKK